jgi:hypothetical protein
MAGSYASGTDTFGNEWISTARDFNGSYFLDSNSNMATI